MTDEEQLSELMRREQAKAKTRAKNARRMRGYAPQWYSSPIALPERTSGAFAIEHDYVSEAVPIVGFRNAFVRGVQPVSAKLDEPLRYHRLTEGGGVWMTDLPEELNQIAEALHFTKPAGSVLVGGLGLGILPALLAARSYVDRVVVVERELDVIALSRPKRAQYEVVHGDIHEYASKVAPDEFDFAMLDTWQGTGEATWWDEVVPLRRALGRAGLAPGRVWCWAEDIMLGQVEGHMLGPRHWKSERLPPMDERELAYFLNRVGTRGWEAKYGKLIEERKP